MNNSENMVAQTNNTNEGCLYVALVVTGIGALAFSILGEWVIFALGTLVAIGLLGLSLWGSTAFILWIYRYVMNTRLEIEERRQNMAIRAALTQQQILVEERRSQLVYAMDGYMPLSHKEILNGSHHDKLLELNARRIEMLRLPENVPNHFHYVVNSDTEQTLNNGANVPIVHGSLGGLDFLPGSQSGKYRLIEDGEENE